MFVLIALELDSSQGSTRSLHRVTQRESREYPGQMVQNVAADRLARCSGYPQAAPGYGTCQPPALGSLHTCLRHLLPTCLGLVAPSFPQLLGSEMRSKHVQGIKETHLLSETTVLGLEVCATRAQTLTYPVLLCEKLKQAPLLRQCTVWPCILQVVQKLSDLQRFSKFPHVI